MKKVRKTFLFFKCSKIKEPRRSATFCLHKSKSVALREIVGSNPADRNKIFLTNESLLFFQMKYRESPHNTFFGEKNDHVMRNCVLLEKYDHFIDI